MRSPRLWRGVSCTLVALCCSYAAPAAAQRAEANLLFDEGRKAMAAHDYGAAIAKLEQSEQLDPAVGTLLNLAECYAVLGRTSSAWSAYRDAASLAASTKQVERERYASRKAQELDPQLSRLVIAVKPEAHVAGLSITRNGVAILEGLWGASIPVDPGAQHIEAVAPGHARWKFDIDVAEGASQARVDVPVLTSTAGNTPSAAPVAPAPSPAPAFPPAALPPVAPGGALPETLPVPIADSPSTSSASSSLSTAGWVTLSTGAVALGAGIFFFADGRSKIKDSSCPNQICVRGIGDKALNDDGRAHEKLGIGLSVASAAIATTGVVLLLLTPKQPSDASIHLQLSVAASGANVQGRW